MERELQHFSHEHPLILKAEERKIDGGAEHSYMEIETCDGCSTPISGPFYGCEECGYFLHRVCAELPNEMNRPMHPQHPLTLLAKPPIRSFGSIFCDVCNGNCDHFVYHCSICGFDVDPVCASVSHTIEDKCHMHPLTPIQHLISLPCYHICQAQEKGLSYKCNICPFWVHQNCTVSLPSTVKHSYHDHVLTLLQSVPPEYYNVSVNCDICHNHLSIFHCVYYCAGCLFCAHVSCTLRSRDMINQDVQLDGQHLALLPVQEKSTDLISWFVKNYRDRDAITNLILGFSESYIDPDTDIKQEIKFFDHEHPLFLIDDHTSEEICEACAQAISPPSYGCIECDYFLHECCTELPKQILHPAHPQHQIRLCPLHGFFRCCCCYQLSNGLAYRCFQCEKFCIDIKCASLLRPVKHEAHRHPLIPIFASWAPCNACGSSVFSNSLLKCNTCSFNLCFRCAMAPPIMIHRRDKHPFMLTYSPPENHYNEYYCDLCEEILNPKFWFYHSSLCDQFCDQFEHVGCMIACGGDSNIKYGKTYKSGDHEHKLSLIRCTYNPSPCSYCSLPLWIGFRAALECVHCDFRIHLLCSSVSKMLKGLNV